MLNSKVYPLTVLCLLCYCTTIQYTADSEKLRTFSLFSESEALNSAAAASQRNPEKSGLIGYYLFGPNEPWSDMCSLSLRSLANAKSSSSRSRTRAEPEKRARARDLSLETHLTTDLLWDRSLTTLTKFWPLLTTYLTANIFESGPFSTPWKFLDRLPLLPSCKLS